MIQAIIDIGSNTVRMALYEIQDGALEMLLKRKQMIGLASYVKDGVMQEEGIEKAISVLSDFRRSLDCLSITRIAAFTTAAMRNAKNSRAVITRIEKETGIAVRVLSGDEEASLAFLGATHDISEGSGMLMDIGGGSTELVLYENRKIKRQISLPLGSLSLRTGHVEGVLPTPAEVESMRSIAGAALSIPAWHDVRAVSVCGIGGTFKAAKALYKICFDAPEGNPMMSAPMLSLLIQRFAVGQILPEKELLLLLRADPDRIHTFLPGLIIAETLFNRFGTQHAQYSDSGVREGFLYREIMPHIK